MWPRGFSWALLWPRGFSWALLWPRGFSWALLWIGLGVGGTPVESQAIALHPTGAQIERALEQGQRAGLERIPPDRLYAWFGSRAALEPRGFLMTKTVGLRVMAAHFALRATAPSPMEIERILADSSLLISVVIFGDRPDFALDSYVVLTQGDRTITPAKVRFDGRAARSARWPGSPAYRAKVVASVPYAELDPTANTRISVFPGSGGEVSFQVDFAKIE